MKRILAIIDGTPLWMWPLLLLLLCLGWQAGQPRTVKLAQLFILPAAIFVMSVVSLYAAAPLFFQLGIVAGCGIGFVAHRENGLRIDREHELLLFPGEWRTMGLIIVVYALRYYWG